MGIIFLVFRLSIDILVKEKGFSEKFCKNLFASALVLMSVGLIVSLVSTMARPC
jgi:hypothetical protein